MENFPYFEQISGSSTKLQRNIYSEGKEKSISVFYNIPLYSRGFDSKSLC